jgi:hypothetical protein
MNDVLIILLFTTSEGLLWFGRVKRDGGHVWMLLLE